MDRQAEEEPWGRRPGGGGVGRLRRGGDDRAGTVPPAPGGDVRGTGRGCGGAGDPATVRECTCQIVHVRTEVRQRIQGAPCSLYSPVGSLHGVQANSLPALPARSCSNVGESVAERRDIIGNLLCRRGVGAYSELDAYTTVNADNGRVLESSGSIDIF